MSNVEVKKSTRGSEKKAKDESAKAPERPPSKKSRSYASSIWRYVWGGRGASAPSKPLGPQGALHEKEEESLPKAQVYDAEMLESLKTFPSTTENTENTEKPQPVDTINDDLFHYLDEVIESLRGREKGVTAPSHSVPLPPLEAPTGPSLDHSEILEEKQETLSLSPPLPLVPHPPPPPPIPAPIVPSMNWVTKKRYVHFDDGTVPENRLRRRVRPSTPYVSRSLPESKRHKHDDRGDMNDEDDTLSKMERGEYKPDVRIEIPPSVEEIREAEGVTVCEILAEVWGDFIEKLLWIKSRWLLL
jgi:hypothetical protein